MADARRRDQKLIDKIPNPNIPVSNQLTKFKALNGTATQMKTKPARWLVKDGKPVSRRGEMLLRELRATKAEAVNPNILPRNEA
jgi:hypothetical protein